jgi:hypothetical protein
MTCSINVRCVRRAWLLLVAAGVPAFAGPVVRPGVPLEIVVTPAVTSVPQALPTFTNEARPSDFDASQLILPASHPLMVRYIEAIGTLRTGTRAEGVQPIAKAELIELQKRLASETGRVLSQSADGVMLMIEPSPSYRLGRVATMLRKRSGGGIIWAPKYIANMGFGAAYKRGWIFSDVWSPVMKSPTNDFLHEVIHDYVELGPHRRALGPLRTQFYSLGEFPGAHDSSSYYAHHGQFSSSEILTNFFSSMCNARSLIALVRRGIWNPESGAPPPNGLFPAHYFAGESIFLAEAVAEMSSKLLPGLQAAMRMGLTGDFQKRWGHWNSGILSREDYARFQNEDLGFYGGSLGSDAQGVEAGFPTLAMARQDGNMNTFPVMFVKARYNVQVDLSMAAIVRQLDIESPQAQKLILAAAAEVLLPNLTSLARLGQILSSDVADMKALRARALVGADLALLEKIYAASQAAFLRTIRFFRASAPV